MMLQAKSRGQERDGGSYQGFKLKPGLVRPSRLLHASFVPRLLSQTGLLFSGFPTKMLFEFFFIFPMRRTYPTHLILLDLIIILIL
jgi:hypothetical protein